MATKFNWFNVFLNTLYRCLINYVPSMVKFWQSNKNIHINHYRHAIKLKKINFEKFEFKSCPINGQKSTFWSFISQNNLKIFLFIIIALCLMLQKQKFLFYNHLPKYYNIFLIYNVIRDIRGQKTKSLFYKQNTS